MRALKFFLVLAALALAPAIAWAGPGDGLAGTHHDFSGKPATTDGETFTTGLCTFCHTPHKALSTLLLWNHTLSTNTFSWDAPTTTAGTIFPTFKGDTYLGPTAKCLSCHDGSVAIGDVAWFGEGKPDVIDPTKHGAGDKFNVGFGGNMAGNHPVAMPYPYGNAKNTYNGVTTGDQATLSEWQATPLANIRMFNDDGSGNISAGVVAAKTGIECSSCHDPHNKAAVDDLFLRGTLGGNTTAYICLKCHIK
jgi:hypothetical protein